MTIGIDAKLFNSQEEVDEFVKTNDILLIKAAKGPGGTVEDKFLVVYFYYI